MSVAGCTHGFHETFRGQPVLSKTILNPVGNLMDTMTYASFAAFRESVADQSNQPAPREAEFTSLDLSLITVTI
jgi:hypothetical protein